MHIDWWTLALQTVNILVLVWLLAHFFFRPVAAIVAQRQDAAQRLLADAKAAQAEAAATRDALEAQRKQVADAQAGTIANAEKAARQRADAIIAAASTAATKLETQAQARIAREQSGAQAALLAHAGVLSIDIAQRLLSSVSTEISATAFEQALSTRVRELSDEDKAALRADPRLSVVSALPLTDQQQRQITASIQAALGHDGAVTYTVEKKLLAGLELRSGSVLVRANWAAALDRIGEELRRDRVAR